MKNMKNSYLRLVKGVGCSILTLGATLFIVTGQHHRMFDAFLEFLFPDAIDSVKMELLSPNKDKIVSIIWRRTGVMSGDSTILIIRRYSEPLVLNYPLDPNDNPAIVLIVDNHHNLGTVWLSNRSLLITLPDERILPAGAIIKEASTATDLNVIYKRAQSGSNH